MQTDMKDRMYYFKLIKFLYLNVQKLLAYCLNQLPLIHFNDFGDIHFSSKVMSLLINLLSYWNVTSRKGNTLY